MRELGVRRRGVSELYATLLMLGVTLAFGGTVTGLAVSQFGLAASASSSGAAIQGNSAGRQLAYLNSYVSQQGTCPSYRGAPEGIVFAVAVLDYGPVSFTPTVVAINGTLYPGAYLQASPGSMTIYTLTLAPRGACAHPSGQTVLIVDYQGDDFQFVS